MGEECTQPSTFTAAIVTLSAQSLALAAVAAAVTIWLFIAAVRKHPGP